MLLSVCSVRAITPKSAKWAEYVACTWRTRKCTQNSGWRHKTEETIWKSGAKLKNNFKKS